MKTTQKNHWDQPIEQFIRSVRLPYRGSCPLCSGVNTFSAALVNGVVLYHCYRASCGLSGKKDYEVTIDDLRSNSLQLVTSSISRLGAEVHYELPNYLVSPLSNTRCYSFLSRFNLLDLYTKFTDRIRYDPRSNRLVFILKDKDNVCRGAVGRLLSYSNINPRWYVYERLQGCPFTLSQGRVSKAILVEDCVSACAITQFIKSDCDGISLLGTAIPDETIKYLLDYEKIFIALDADATNKSLQLQKRLNPFVDTSIIATKKDLKYYSSDDFKQLENEYLKNGKES